MNFGRMITGLLMGIFGYTIIFTLALFGYRYAPQYFGVTIYRAPLVSMGLNFYLVASIAGAVGGMLGGDADEKNGSAIGGMILGLLSGIVMIGLMVSGRL